jgi:hypothetical protein
VARRSGDREPLDPRRIIPNNLACLPFVRGIAVYWLYNTLSYWTVVLAEQARASLSSLGLDTAPCHGRLLSRFARMRKRLPGKIPRWLENESWLPTQSSSTIICRRIRVTLPEGRMQDVSKGTIVCEAVWLADPPRGKFISLSYAGRKITARGPMLVDESSRVILRTV